MDGGSIHNELVIGAAAGILAGLHYQGAGVAQLSLAPAQGMLRQLSGREVTVYGSRIDDAECFQTVGFHKKSSF